MSFIRSLFEGYKEARPNRRDWEYTWIADNKYPGLHSSQYLNELYAKARTDEQKDYILTHIYRFEAEGIDSYKRIEQKIINERWK